MQNKGQELPSPTPKKQSDKLPQSPQITPPQDHTHTAHKPTETLAQDSQTPQPHRDSTPDLPTEVQTPKTPKNSHTTKTPQESQTKTSDTKKDTTHKRDERESHAQALPKDSKETTQSPLSTATAALHNTHNTQESQENTIIQEEIVVAEEIYTPSKEHHKDTHELSAPKTQKQDNPQKPQAQPSTKNTSTQQAESAPSGDSKQQSSHTPLDSQKSQTNQSTQVANEEFLQDLEQSAQHIEHIQKSSESKPTKQAQAPQTPKDTPQNPTNTTSSTQHIKPEVIYRSVAARESVRNFASQLSQEVLNYKPPITKLSLELNPQNLGTLELTISKNGKDLQVQVVSNPTAINLFVNNQVELRNNLAQMGFNNVDLNFSQNGANSGQKNQQERRNQHQSHQANEGNENSLESHTMFITIPQYA